MNRYAKYGLLLMLGNSQGFSLPSAYWQCTTHDNTNKEWSARSIYQKAALNIAYAECKKESSLPKSCKASMEECEGFNQNMSLKPTWRCTALDEDAKAWQSNFYRHREDAALAAKAYCKEKSVVPETCYINLVTCASSSEGASM